MTPGNFSYFLPQLAQHQVHFVLIGGGAAIAHGLARATYDVDIVYDRKSENLARLVSALAETNPYYRGAPLGLPFNFDEETLSKGLNFTLTTDRGDIDLLGEVAGEGTYPKLIDASEKMEIYGVQIAVVNLETLIHLKRSAGRAKDLETIAELEILKNERGL